MTKQTHSHLSEAGRAPGEHLVDTGYVSIDHVVRARTEHGIALTGPMRRRHQHQELARLRVEQSTEEWKRRYGMRAGGGDHTAGCQCVVSGDP